MVSSSLVDNLRMLGKFPQGLTHVSQTTRWLALAAMDDQVKLTGSVHVPIRPHSVTSSTL